MRSRGLVLPLVCVTVVVLAVVTFGMLAVVRSLTDDATTATTQAGSARQTTTVTPVDGGVALDIVLTPAATWPDRLRVQRQYVDQNLSDPAHVLHEQTSGLTFDDVTVNGVSVSGSGRTYPPVDLGGRSPVRITGVIRPYSSSPGARVAWIAPPVLGVRLTEHTIVFTQPPVRSGIPRGVVGADQQAVLAPCPSTTSLHLTTAAGQSTTARVEY